MQSKTGFPSSHQLKSYGVPKSRLKLAERCPVSGCWPSCGFWATVCKTVRPMLSVRCPVCLVLSVTLVYCGQTVGWIKMKLGKQVGLSLGHTVLDWDPPPPLPKGHGPQFSAHFYCKENPRQPLLLC